MCWKKKQSVGVKILIVPVKDWGSALNVGDISAELNVSESVAVCGGPCAFCSQNDLKSIVYSIEQSLQIYRQIMTM